MRLNVTEKPAFAQDVIDRNDPGRFLVLVERRGRRDAQVTEPRGIMSRHQFKRILRDAVAPDLPVVRLVAHVFLKEDRTAPCNRDVVEHVAGLGTIQQARNAAANFGVGDVGEAEAIEPAAADLSADAIFDLVVTVGGDEVVVARVIRIPGAVLGAEELGAVFVSLRVSSPSAVRPETSPKFSKKVPLSGVFRSSLVAPVTSGVSPSILTTWRLSLLLWRVSPARSTTLPVVCFSPTQK
jgi:hypothetical protein